MVKFQPLRGHFSDFAAKMSPFVDIFVFFGGNFRHFAGGISPFSSPLNQDFHRNELKSISFSSS